MTLLVQFGFFPKAAHDDRPDALEIAVETFGKTDVFRPGDTRRVGPATFVDLGSWKHDSQGAVGISQISLTLDGDLLSC